MEASQTEVLTQSTLRITSGFLYLELANHVSGSLSGVALVPSHLTKLLKEQCSNAIQEKYCHNTVCRVHPSNLRCGQLKFVAQSKRNFLSPGQTIATFKRKISQHYWAQHVARLATLLRMLGVEIGTSAHARVQDCCKNALCPDKVLEV